MKVIFVDADACPVKDEIVKIATYHRKFYEFGIKKYNCNNWL